MADGTAVQIGYYQGATSEHHIFGNGDENTSVPLSVQEVFLELNSDYWRYVPLNFAANGEIFADIDISWE